jgi:hypothetical protein
MIYLIFERIDIKPEAKREKRGERKNNPQSHIGNYPSNM